MSAAMRCTPPGAVAILKVADLRLSLPLALVWRKDNLSPLLAKFVADVGSLAKRKPERPLSDKRLVNQRARR